MSDKTDRIAERIKLARTLTVSDKTGRAMTQEEAAQRLSVSARTYIRWEHGESEGFMSRLDDIASVFGTTSDELIGDQNALLADLLVEVRELREEVQTLTGGKD